MWRRIVDIFKIVGMFRMLHSASMLFFWFLLFVSSRFLFFDVWIIGMVMQDS